MASLDDELALFESEISSIIAEQPSSSSSSPSPAIQKPPTPPVVAINPMYSKPNLLPPVPPRLAGVIPPIPATGFFVPQQIKISAPASSAAKPSAVLEAGPTLYKEDTVEKEPVVNSQVYALPADIIAMEQKKCADVRKENLRKNEKNLKPKAFLRSGGGQVWEDKSLAEWDQNDFRIFCGDLGNEVSDELLAKAFRKFPSFQRAKVVRDARSNKSKGYGFVSFKDADDYARAMREMDGKYVGNRPIKLRKSNWKDRQFEVVKKKQKTKAKLGLW